MKFIQHIKLWVPVLLCACLLACDPNTKQEASRDFSDFNNWVNQNAARADMLTDEEWNDLNAEFETRSAELEAESNQWDDATKQEWQEIKDKWAEVESQVQQNEQRVEPVGVDLDMDTVSKNQ